MSTENITESVDTLIIKQVHYDVTSTLPYEYIEFLPKKFQEKCIEKIKENKESILKQGVDLSKCNIPGISDEIDGMANLTIKEDSKSQKRGGKASGASKKLEKQLEKSENVTKVEKINVNVGLTTKGKRRNITVVSGWIVQASTSKKLPKFLNKNL